MQTETETQKPNQKKAMMKAAVIREFGGPEVIHIEEIEKPQAKAGHVLVKVLAAGINRLDHYVRGGGYIPKIDSYRILGADAAGEIAELGEGVTGLKVGERVIVVAGFATERKDKDHRPTITAPSFAFPEVQINGTYTQYMEVPDYAVVKDETGLTVEEAATLPVVLGTSVHALKQVAGVKAGDKVLIHSGASGSGSMQIQVAKALGAKVAATVRSAEKGEYAKNVGADLVINMREVDFVEKIKEWTDGAGVDAVIDNLGGDILAQSIEAIRPFGVVVVYGFSAGAEAKIDVRNVLFSEKKLLGSMGSDVEDFQWGLQQVKAGRIKPLVYRVFPLDEVVEAHKLIAENKVQGNIVLLPWAE